MDDTTQYFSMNFFCIIIHSTTLEFYETITQPPHRTYKTPLEKPQTTGIDKLD